MIRRSIVAALLIGAAVTTARAEDEIGLLSPPQLP